ncbi:hypothetical protein GQ457_12G014330 [Hibiscus cannabinus]
MKAILPHCISNTQAAFVQGRAITDNILVAHELVHTLHTSVSRPSQGAVFKLDMEKAFDRVEWLFLKAVMLCLGFAASWVDLIMRCVSSVSSRVRVRGALSAAFRPQRGLRQGDPLSPFLFLFCSEGLSAALTTAQHEGHLPGVRASKHGPPVNHLLFADDNLVDDPCIYLGVPLLIGKNKYVAFGRYRDKVDTRVSKWSNLLLSFSGREVLIKSIAQAFPQYVMSCYLLPCSLVEEMSRSIRRFWWSGKGSARGWPLVAWDDICLPKTVGGIGFKDLHLFNIALLGKQIWRLLSAPVSLLYSSLRAKYFPDGDLLRASAPACSSFAWKGLHRAMLCLRDGFYWTLGIDSRVCLFRDRWGGRSLSHQIGQIRSSGVIMTRASIPFALAIFFSGGPPLPLARHCVCGKFWRSFPQFRRFAPLVGDVVGKPFLWAPDFGMRVYLMGPVHFAVVDWLGFATSSLSMSSFALFLSILWGLWRRHNTWVHERSLYPLHLVVEDVVLLYLDYASASAPTQIPPTAAADPPRWCPPPAGSVKVNVDGAFLPSARLCAIGVIARDCTGAVLGGFAKPVPVHGPASTVEVSDLFAGLEFAIANAWPSALIESDAVVLVNKLHRPTVDLSLLGDLLAPSRALLATNAGHLHVGFASRLANTAAHTLASWACHNDNVISFSSVCPELISRIVLDDLSSSF